MYVRSFCLWMSAFVAAGCGEEAPVPEPPLRPVRTIEVASTGGERSRTFSGVAQADIESTLSFRVSGNLKRLLVRTGDHVKAGQLIAELDPTDYALRVQEAEAALIQAEAQARQADAEYGRMRGLYENRNASRSDLDASRAASESTQAQIDAARQRLEQARAQLSYTRLLAPASGSIGRVPVEVNENVESADSIAVLASGERSKVDVPVPGGLIRRIVRGSEVDVHFDALPGRMFDAVITEVGVMSTTLATMFPVTVQLIRAEPDVRAGMAAAVVFSFAAEDSRARFVLPSQSVVEDRGGRFVYIVETTEPGIGTIRRQPVTVGALTGEGLEVLEGLEDGDRVVIAGMSQITDGLEVKVTS